MFIHACLFTADDVIGERIGSHCGNWNGFCIRVCRCANCPRCFQSAHIEDVKPESYGQDKTKIEDFS